MLIARLVIAVLMLIAADASAQVTPPAPAPPSAVQQPAPPAPGTAAPAGTTPAPAATLVAPTARAFTAPTGIILNAVRPERAVDFELVIGYVQAALTKSASPQIRAQAGGWRMFKAAEPGPNNTVLYIFLLDPAVAGADYALGPILSDAYPDQVEQIWKLYQGALAGAGSQSLLNLTPVEPPPLPPAGAPVPPPAGTVASPPTGTTAP
jgi:pyruvate/2-oxoglutarate dehydrogenase complex dihydrolipoamide acyltransferase (E2) component